MRFLLILLFAAPASATYYSGNKLSLSGGVLTGGTTFQDTVKFGTSPVDGGYFDKTGILRFDGAGAYRVRTGFFAFSADASPLAGLSFNSNGAGGFKLTDTNFVQVWSMKTTGQMNIGLLTIPFGVSTFTAAGALNVPNSITSAQGNIVATAGDVTAGGNVNVTGLVANGYELVTNACGAGVTTCTATCSGTNVATGCSCNATLGVPVDETPSTTACQCDTAIASNITAYVYCGRFGN